MVSALISQFAEHVPYFWLLAGVLTCLALYTVWYLLERAAPPLVYYLDTPLNRYIAETCKKLHSRYFPTPWILNGDMLTILGIIFRKKYNFEYRRYAAHCPRLTETVADSDSAFNSEYVINQHDGARLSIDWVEGNNLNSKKILILLPGVTGHSASPYLVHMIKEASDEGWRVATMIYPGFDGERITAPRFIRVHDHTDLATIVDHIHAQNPDSKIVVIGWSMGACLLVKYLGTVGENTPISCAVSACNPWCPYEARSVVADKLHRRLLYNVHFRQAMMENFRNNFEIFKEHLPHLSLEDAEKKFFWLEDFDESVMLPLSGAEDLVDYYRRSGCIGEIRAVAKPLLVAHADDDPVVPHHALPIDDITSNPNILFIRTQAGGHTGWLSGIDPRGTSWFDHLALEWATHVMEYVETHHPKYSADASSFLTTSSRAGPRTRAMTKRVNEEITPLVFKQDSSPAEEEQQSPKLKRRRSSRGARTPRR